MYNYYTTDELVETVAILYLYNLISKEPCCTSTLVIYNSNVIDSSCYAFWEKLEMFTLWTVCSVTRLCWPLVLNAFCHRPVVTAFI